MKTYLVGGAVRDMKMGHFPKDNDYVVVGATPEEMFKRGFAQVGADFPVFLHPDTKEEFALARREKTTGPGYHDFQCEFGKDVTLEEDLRRRDLTINAMALDDGNNTIDPFGGVKDIEDRVLRHVDSTSFVEDPVRALRLARFAARFPDFEVHHETREMIFQMGKSGALAELTAERVYSELSRALTSEDPRRFFDTLLECDVLHILFPEVYALVSATEWKRHHPEGNAYEHTMLVVTAMRCSGEYDLSDMFNALCHDLGKAATPKKFLPRHNGHDVTGVPIAEAFLDRLKAPAKIKQSALHTTRYHMMMHNVDRADKELAAKGICKMFDACVHGDPDFPERLLKLGKADARGRLGYHDRDVTDLNDLRKLYSAYKSPTFANVIGDRKLSGEVIRSEMHRARYSAVKDVILAMKNQRRDQEASNACDMSNEGLKL